MDRIAIQAGVRFGLGAGSGGTSKADLLAQLHGPDPGIAAGAFAGLVTGQQAVDTHQQVNQARQAGRKAGMIPPKVAAPLGQIYKDDGTAQLAWAASTNQGFRERLVWFWANHFSVSVSQNETTPYAGAMLREAIRPYVNGNFTDMVLAVESHSAMLRFLDNFVSVGPNSPAGMRRHLGLNENLGRECLELHTVGLQAGYSQADVTNMAKILTGWTMAPTLQGGNGTTGYRFRPQTHEPGAQTLMGKSFGGGQQSGIDALVFLSTYPTTYQLLATKLVTHFVADQPPPAAVRRIAGVLRDTKGDLAAAAASLVELPQAWTSLTKLKTPFDYVVSTMRAAPAPPAQKPPNAMAVMAALGQPLWNAPLPNGWPDTAANWNGSDALMARIDWAYTYAGRFDHGAAGAPLEIAEAALGPYLRPETVAAMRQAGSRQEALTLFFAAPEFQRR